MFYITLACKNIFRDPKRSITLGINYFFVAFLLLIVFSITNGVKKNITGNIISSTAGHITISGEYTTNGKTFQGINGYKRIDSLAHSLFPDVRIITRYTIISPVYYKGISKRLSLMGIDPAVETRLRSQISLTDTVWNSFTKDSTAVILPQSIARYFGLATADDILIATRTRFGAFNTGTARIAGLYTTGNYFLREQVLSHFAFIQALDLADSVTTSKMYLFFDDFTTIDQKRARLISALSRNGFIAQKPASNTDAINAVAAASPRRSTQENNHDQRKLTLATADEVTGIVSKVVAAINGTGLFVAAIMLFIIAVSIFINMRMTINERLQEIGTLRALGAEQHDVTILFIAENIALSLLFICMGIIFGILVMTVGTALVTLPADGTLGLFLNNGHLVMQPTFEAIVFISTILVAFTALFSYFPARYGAKIPAVRALNATPS